MAIKLFTGLSVADTDSTQVDVFNKLSHNAQELLKRTQFRGCIFQLNEPFEINSWKRNSTTNLGVNFLAEWNLRPIVLNQSHLIFDPYNMVKWFGQYAYFEEKGIIVESSINIQVADSTGYSFSVFDNGSSNAQGSSTPGHGRSRYSGHMINMSPTFGSATAGALSYSSEDYYLNNLNLGGDENVTLPVTVVSITLSHRVIL